MIVEEEIGQMSLQVEKLEGNMAKLTIEASAEDFEKAVEKAYQRSKSKVSVPGFRKGKVPRKIIEQMYGKEIFMRMQQILPFLRHTRLLWTSVQRRLCHSRPLRLCSSKQENPLSLRRKLH